MKYKKILLLLIVLLPVISVTNVRAAHNIPPESLETGNTAFYLCAANASQTLEVNLTHMFGDFDLYLFNKRPWNTDIDTSSLIGEDDSDNASISYSVPEDKIYYVQIDLVDSGPAVFTISCSHDLIRYYIPQIPGFSLEIIIISLISGFGLVYILHKKKIRSL